MQVGQCGRAVQEGQCREGSAGRAVQGGQCGKGSVGRAVEGFSLPVCTIFHPRDVGGQLCFSTNLSSIEKLPSLDQGSSKGGSNQCYDNQLFICPGLTLAIDYNSERSINNGTKVRTQRSFFC